MIEMISPSGKRVSVPEQKVERNLQRGFTLPQPEPVFEDEDLNENEGIE